MDASTIILHQAILRHAKGALRAYETWISEQEIVTLSSRLKRERAELAHIDGRERDT